MPTHPKLLPFYLMGFLFFSAVINFCFGAELSQLQKEARTYRIQGYTLQQEDPQAAIPYYQKALTLDPNYAVAYNDLGIIFETFGDKESAKDMYLKAIKIAPGYPNSYSNLALVYEEEEDYANALYYWQIRRSLGEASGPWAEKANEHIAEILGMHPDRGEAISIEHKEMVLEPDKIQGVVTEEAELQNKIKELEKKIEELDSEIELKGEGTQAVKPEAAKPVLATTTESPAEKELKNKIKELEREIDKVDLELQSEGSNVAAIEVKPEPKMKEKPAVLQPKKIVETKPQDDKARALDYLATAKENFSRGQYVAALKEATVAGYLDPSNEEISAFVEKVRKTLLE